MPQRLHLQASSDARVVPLLSPKNPLSSILLPIVPSLAGSSAHLQDLQQQINTRSLAFDALQREHQNLLLAFSRSQSRVAILDKNAAAYEIKIKELNEDRVGLQIRVEAFEAQMQELQKTREDAHNQSITKGAQYMKIVAMSSKLQAQGASDSQKWKAEREQWELETKANTTRFSILESEKQALLRALDGSQSLVSPLTHNHPAAASTVIESGDPHSPQRILWEQARELQIKCTKLEKALQSVRHESSNFGQAFARLGAIGKRLQEHLQIPPAQINSQDRLDDLHIEREDSVMSEERVW